MLGRCLVVGLLACAAPVLVTSAASGVGQVPSVSTVTVASGPVQGGTRTVLHGTGFTDVRAVLFGSTPGTRVRVLAPWTIEVYSPAHAPGAVHVLVLTKRGVSLKVLADEFRYVPAPTVSVPAPGLQAGTVTELHGGPFVNVRQVTVGGVPAVFSVLTSGVLRIQVPRVPTSALIPAAGDPLWVTAPVQVIDAYGRSAAVATQYFDAPSVKAAVMTAAAGEPSGLTTGGTQLRIFGHNIVGQVSVYFGDTPATSVTLDGSTVFATVTAPPHAPGAVDIRITTPAGTSAVTSADRFIYRPPSSLTWGTPTVIDPAGKYWAVSCPTTTFCAVVDWAGQALTYNGSSWTTPAVVDAAGDLMDVSCHSATFCVAVDAHGNAVTFDGTNWSAPVAVGHSLFSVSCPTSSFCMAAADDGNTYRFDGATWVATGSVDHTTQQVGPEVYIACVSASFCAATDYAHAITYNGTSWSSPTSLNTPMALFRVACSSANFCVTTDGAGNAETYNGATWSAPADAGTSQTLGLSCPTSTFCAALDLGGKVQTFDGTNWSMPAPIGAPDATDASCASPTFCIAITRDGSAIIGH